ncbi:MAG TPA: DUF4159 domain-containing protein [Pirellulales bacterium]|nr:DUF4159 domain-containing protein [Pirellulales bacterium]
MAGRPLAWLFLALYCAASVAPPARADVTAEQVREAIDRGVTYLRRQQFPDGSWQEIAPIMAGGVTSLCTLALLNAGVPKDDPQIQAALNILRQIPAVSNYPTALQTMVFAIAEPEKDIQLLRRNVRWIEEQQKRDAAHRGMWSYPLGNGDNSNSQFAILALYEAQRAGVSISPHILRTALSYWTQSQNSDGSWGYQPGQQGTGSMTCAGIGAVALALDVLEEGDATVEGANVRCCRPHRQQGSIDQALDWLAKHFSVRSNPNNNMWPLYYLYGLERAGRLTNQRFVGLHDWYREGSEVLVEQQNQVTGAWIEKGLGQINPNIGTSFALLFLAKGRRPVVAAKLKHQPNEDWNHHRKDLAHVVEYAEKRWKRDLTWQIIDVDAATTEDLLEAPVLYLCGEDAPQMSDEEVRMLRDYINRGGFILGDAVCGGKEFDRGFRALVERVFPEPEYKLRLLPPEHPIWSAEEPVDARYQRPLWGIDLGCRTCVVYCPENLSCYWELAREHRERKYGGDMEARIDAAKKIGVNVLAYATNRDPKYKLDLPQLAGAGPREAFDRAKLYVATVRHSGGANVAPLALPNLLRYLSGELGLRANTDDRELGLADDRLFEFPVVFMHGREKFSLSEQEREKLKTFLQRGGVLFADAICTSEAFAGAFRQEIATMFPDHPLKTISADDPLFTTKYGGFDLKTVTRREAAPPDADGRPKTAVREVAPELEVLQLDDRYAVIFSRYDLSCALEKHETAGCFGYSSDSAARIGLNALLYAIEQ